MRSPTHGLWTVAVSTCLALTGLRVDATTLGIVDDQYFTITREVECATWTETVTDTVFLYGVTYYAALTGPEDGNWGSPLTDWESRVEADLDNFETWGFNWVRVWTHWGNDLETDNFSVTDPNGNCSAEPYLTNMQRLVDLIKECDARGIIVDITFYRDHPDDSDVSPHNYIAHRACVETVCDRLESEFGDGPGNFYFDLCNESHMELTDPWGGSAVWIDPAEIEDLRSLVGNYSTNWFCTCSYVHSDFEYFLEWPDIVEEYIEDCGLDFITPHLDRWSSAPMQTVSIVREYRDLMKPGNGIGVRVPIHLQEPFRWGVCWDLEPYDWQLPDYFRDCTGGKVAGAAGWCFHTPAGQDLHDLPLGLGFQEKLQAIESDVVNNMLPGDNHLGSVYAYARRYQAEYPEQLDYPRNLYEGGAQDLNRWAWMLFRNPSPHPSYVLNEGPADDLLPAGTARAIWHMCRNSLGTGDSPLVSIGVEDNYSPLIGQMLWWSDFENPWPDWYDFELEFPLGSGAHIVDLPTARPLVPLLRLVWLDYVEVAKGLGAEIDGPTPVYALCEEIWDSQPSGGTGVYTYAWYYQDYADPGNPGDWNVIEDQTDRFLVWAATLEFEEVRLKVVLTDDLHPTDSTIALYPVSVILRKMAPSLPGPTEYALGQNCPNPFRSAALIRYQLPEPGRVSLIIYDVRGREVARLVNREAKQPGYYSVSWEPKDLSAGLYTYRLNAGDFVGTKRLVFTGSN